MYADKAIAVAYGDGWAVTGLSAANTAGALAKAAASGKCHYLTSFAVGIAEAAAANTAAGFLIEIKDGTTVIWQERMIVSAPVGTQIARTFPIPIRITSGAALTLAVAATGASSKSLMSMSGYTI